MILVELLRVPEDELINVGEDDDIDLLVLEDRVRDEDGLFFFNFILLLLFQQGSDFTVRGLIAFGLAGLLGDGLGDPAVEIDGPSVHLFDLLRQLVLVLPLLDVAERVADLNVAFDSLELLVLRTKGVKDGTWPDRTGRRGRRPPGFA